jgi:hypothetical protein
MLHLAILLAAATAAATAPAAPPAAPGVPGATLYRVELSGGQSSWAMGKPQPNGSLLLFKHYPDGALMSVRASDVKKIVAGAPTEEGKRLKPGQLVEIGATGGGLPSSGGGLASASAARAAGAGAVPPGASKDGSALFNPDRKYNPAWDSKLVPGQTMGFPNSPNDYVEGKTFAHPPAPATQAAPGDVPRAPELPQ